MKQKAIAALLALALLAGCGISSTEEQVSEPEDESSRMSEPSGPEGKPVPASEGGQSVPEQADEPLKTPAAEDALASGGALSSASSGEAAQKDEASGQAAESVSQQMAVPQPAPSSQAATPSLNEGTVFEGYPVTVEDWTEPAAYAAGLDWPITTWYFFGEDDEILGSISGAAMLDITDRYYGSMEGSSSDDWSVWFAEAFNKYRGTGDYVPPERSPEDYEDRPNGGTYHLEDALEVILLTNEERESHGLEPLEMDEDLMELARVRAAEAREKYSHERPDGTHIVDLGYGENLGARSSAAEQVSSWMNSEGHRKNILWEKYHSMGAGCYEASNGNLYWIQVFSFS